MRAISLLVLIVVQGCAVTEFCYGDRDCDPDQRCSAEGRCESTEVITDLGTPTVIMCPLDGMVKVANLFCIDRYEASRTDATETSEGIDDSQATSREGVLPWQVTSNQVAEQACNASGKRLCKPTEWYRACSNNGTAVYGYGDTYSPTTCNGIDAFGPWTEYKFKLMPTGSFSGCKNAYGVYDINGNLWEHTHEGSDMTIRGGAYNCSDSKTLHRCDYVPGTWVPTARGFRCCADGVPVSTKTDH